MTPEQEHHLLRAVERTSELVADALSHKDQYPALGAYVFGLLQGMLFSFSQECTPSIKAAFDQLDILLNQVY